MNITSSLYGDFLLTPGILVLFETIVTSEVEFVLVWIKSVLFKVTGTYEFVAFVGNGAVHVQFLKTGTWEVVFVTGGALLVEFVVAPEVLVGVLVGVLDVEFFAIVA